MLNNLDIVNNTNDKIIYDAYLKIMESENKSRNPFSMCMEINDPTLFSGIKLGPTELNEISQLNIGISGSIGVGKSTMTKKLGQLLGMTTLGEYVDKERLEEFYHFLETRSKLKTLMVNKKEVEHEEYAAHYKDMDGRAALFQLFQLENRYRLNESMKYKFDQEKNKRIGYIQDRTVFCDNIFAQQLYNQGDISKSDYEMYKKYFDTFRTSFAGYDVFMLLDADVDVTIERILQRNRSCELSIPKSYLSGLIDAHKKFAKEGICHAFPTVILNWNKFVELENVAKIIYATYRMSRNTFNGMSYY